MAGLKRLFGPALVFSVVGHCGLLLALLFAGSARVLPVPPEAIAIEIVRSEELETPHVEGTPLDSTSSGSEVSSDSKKGSVNTAPPRPKMKLPSLQQSQARANLHDSEIPAAVQPQTAPPAEGEAPPLPSTALVPPTPRVQPQPHHDEAALVLPGARNSGGLDAPASNPAMLPHDDTALFRARLGTCSRLPAGVAANDSAKIELLVSFKRDGTLASSPKLLWSSPTADAMLLTKEAVKALERCQPFAELPADKYEEWQTLDLVMTLRTLAAP